MRDKQALATATAFAYSPSGNLITYHHTGIIFTCLKRSKCQLSNAFAVVTSGYPGVHRNQRSVLVAPLLIGISQNGRGLRITKELIQLIRPGIVRLAFFNNDRDQVGSATGFLSNNFLVTCSHVIRKKPFDSVELTFGDQNLRTITPIRLSSDTLINNIKKESLESEYDYAIIHFSEPEIKDRYQLQFTTPKKELVGEQVLILGFPFGTEHLTAHIGYISSDFMRRSAHVFQIDGSINPGNSGGPLVHIASASVIGIVTRAETGLDKDFDQLTESIKDNVKALERRKGGSRIIFGGFDPIQSIHITMNIFAKVVFNMQRGANVGIGFCISSEHIIQTGLIKEIQ